MYLRDEHVIQFVRHQPLVNCDFYSKLSLVDKWFSEPTWRKSGEMGEFNHLQVLHLMYACPRRIGYDLFKDFVQTKTDTTTLKKPMVCMQSRWLTVCDAALCMKEYRLAPLREEPSHYVFSHAFHDLAHGEKGTTCDMLLELVKKGEDPDGGCHCV